MTHTDPYAYDPTNGTLAQRDGYYLLVDKTTGQPIRRNNGDEITFPDCTSFDPLHIKDSPEYDPTDDDDPEYDDPDFDDIYKTPELPGFNPNQKPADHDQ